MKYKVCSMCSSVNYKILRTKDYNRRNSNKIYEYSQCYNCSLISIIDKNIGLDPYYKTSLSPFDLTDKKFNKILKKNRYFLKFFNKFLNNGNILEIGPGFGYFSLLLKKNNFNIDIIEQDHDLCEFYKTKLNFKNIKEDDIFNVKLTDDKYDAVVAWQVIEHLKYPDEWILKIRNSIKAKGYFFLSTPNASSFQFKIMKSLWPHIDTPRHQFIYTPDLIKNIMEKNNFTLVNINWGIDTILWNRFGWISFVKNTLNIKNKIFNKILGNLLFLLFFPLESIPGYGSSFIQVYKKNI